MKSLKSRRTRSTWLVPFPWLCAVLVMLTPAGSTAQSIERGFGISPDGHHIIKPNGKPLYWIGDTGWALFQQLTREEIDEYLDDRQAKGFNVIQSVAYWYPHGPQREPLGPSNAANAYGHCPFSSTSDGPNTSLPLVVEGGAADKPNDYWDHVEYAMNATRVRDMTFVVLPCWGNAFVNNRMQGSQIEFTEDQARAYGRWLGKRFRDQPHLIWCLGGDVDPVNFAGKDQRSVYRAMAEGIGRGASGNDSLRWNVAHEDWDRSFITFHAVRTPKQSGAEGGSSSTWFHKDEWLDFNMMETFRWMHQIHPHVTTDYQLQPTKPTVLGEGAYELGKYGGDCGFITDLQVRRQGYQAFFAGGAGYTYGCWAIWPFRGEYCGKNWRVAMDLPGATQCGKVMHKFIVDQSMFSFLPNQRLIVSDNPEGESFQCAVIKQDKSQAMIYFPTRKSVTVDMDVLQRTENVKVEWFDPRNGTRVSGVSQRNHSYEPPKEWEDAILILTAAQEELK